MKKLIAAMAVGFAFTFAVSAAASVKANVEGIENKVVRVHILADSDSERDQRLKLLVRDGVVEFIGEKLKDCESQNEAKQIISSLLDETEQVSERILRENGSNDSVSCELVSMYFERRDYGTFSLPAGKYDALRVKIGEAKGHNWWCVCFPSLCIAPSVAAESGYFTDEEIAIMQYPEKFKLKLKIYELFLILEKFFGQ